MRNLRQDAWRRLRRNYTALVSLAFIVVVILMAVLAPIIAPYHYAAQDSDNNRQGPSARHLLGTDELGRDLLSRMIYGSQVSISVGLMATGMALFAGTGLGLISGYYGGAADLVIMRVTDFMFAFPDILLAILIMSVLGPSIWNVFAAISLTNWAGLARIVRGQVLSLKEREFTEAARSMGARDGRIMFGHILPNILSQIIVWATMHVGGFILYEAILSYLGIGVQAPFPSWGLLIYEAVSLMRMYPYMLFFPAALLSLTILAFNFLGDGLLDALDPRLEE
ncbi:MAG: ABC transporter permease [Actinobacteria bacterium]|nr:ABC transporter permease [Actinomycetota bacterium]